MPAHHLDEWKIYSNFHHWNMFNMVAKAHAFLLHALESETKRQELIQIPGR
jgi:hypothetical protein